MNFQKFTHKSIEAVNSAQSIAHEYGNSELKQVHLFLALIKQEDGLIGGLMDKISHNIKSLEAETQLVVEQLPKVSGGDIFVSKELANSLSEAEKQAEYIF